jgi:hypothetical protein
VASEASRCKLIPRFNRGRQGRDKGMKEMKGRKRGDEDEDAKGMMY